MKEKKVTRKRTTKNVQYQLPKTHMPFSPFDEIASLALLITRRYHANDLFLLIFLSLCVSSKTLQPKQLLLVMKLWSILIFLFSLACLFMLVGFAFNLFTYTHLFSYDRCVSQLCPAPSALSLVFCVFHFKIECSCYFISLICFESVSIHFLCCVCCCSNRVAISKLGLYEWYVIRAIRLAILSTIIDFYCMQKEYLLGLINKTEAEKRIHGFAPPSLNSTLTTTQYTQ